MHNINFFKIKKIDPSLFNPPEFYIDLNDDNFLLGLPDDPLLNPSDEAASGAAISAAKGKETESTESKRDKNKSKNLLGRTVPLKDDQNTEADVKSKNIYCEYTIFS